MNQFLAGAAAMSLFVIVLFFLRFWKKTHDRLFLLFAGAFFTLMLERIIRAVIGENDWTPYVYTVRLAAFVLIIIAVIDKNRRT